MDRAELCKDRPQTLWRPVHQRPARPVRFARSVEAQSCQPAAERPTVGGRLAQADPTLLEECSFRIFHFNSDTLMTARAWQPKEQSHGFTV